MELFVLLFLFLINGFFSMSEMAVVSSRKARLQQLYDEGHAAAGAALDLANNPGNFLSAIQVGITVIGITSGAFGERALAADVSAWLSTWPVIAPHAQVIAVTLVIVGITIASLIIGELVPKRLALMNPEAVASLVARPMKWVAIVAHPLVKLLGIVTEAILRMLGRRAVASPPVSEEEIRVLMAQGTEAGVFEEHEHQLVSRVFRMDDLRTAAVMTPRTDIVYLNMDESREAILRRIAEAPHTHFPVTRGDLDNIEGVVSVKELLVDMVRSEPFDLATRLRKPLYIPETLTVTEVLRAFKQHHEALALIVNEYGEFQGMVTLHDVMEALVGDIGPEIEEADRDIVRREDGSFLIDGGVGVDRLKQALGIAQELPEEDTGTYNTVAGFVMLRLGRVPQAADYFEWGGLRFEVVDMDRNRVDKLLVTPISQVAPPRDPV